MSDDDWDETWEAGDFVKAWILGPLTGALWMGAAFEALATYVGGVQKRFGGGPMDVAKDVFSGLESIFGGTDEVEFKDVMNFLNSISKAVGGDAAAIGVSVNILKQLLGIYDRASDQD